MFMRAKQDVWRKLPCDIDINRYSEKKILLKWKSNDNNQLRNLSVTLDDSSHLSLENYVKSHLLMLFQFLSVLNCSNVELVDNEVKERINSKRTKKGKLPFFEYKTLHVNTTRVENQNTISAGANRSSPRVHLRRGHIRRLSTGKTTWIQPCLVGDRDSGVIEKDYSVC